ncbi:MAG: HDIG domain-containing protein [Sphingobacteriia bacterium]|nr:HDIG domain-containing protein [Sphingobacteriia bacterium]
MRMTAQSIADEIINLLVSHGGSEYIGEPVTKLEHMVQSAMMAEDLQLGDEMIIAALLHDIGHVCVETSEENDMDGFGVIDHEKTGAEYLQLRGFSQRIIDAVANHVPAKRYLCYRFKEYNDALSVASKRTLEFQGGPMSAEEAAAFERLAWFKDIIALRKIDEMAKMENVPLPANLDKYRTLIIEHLTNKPE